MSYGIRKILDLKVRLLSVFGLFGWNWKYVIMELSQGKEILGLTYI
jgi:hypothetical protein